MLMALIWTVVVMFVPSFLEAVLVGPLLAAKPAIFSPWSLAYGPGGWTFSPCKCLFHGRKMTKVVQAKLKNKRDINNKLLQCRNVGNSASLRFALHVVALFVLSQGIASLNMNRNLSNPKSRQSWRWKLQKVPFTAQQSSGSRSRPSWKAWKTLEIIWQETPNRVKIKSNEERRKHARWILGIQLAS